MSRCLSIAAVLFLGCTSAGCNYEDAGAYYNRGNAWMHKGESDKAIAEYDEAIRLDPKHLMAYKETAVGGIREDRSAFSPICRIPAAVSFSRNSHAEP